jgi:hypothetical protein
MRMEYALKAVSDYWYSLPYEIQHNLWLGLGTAFFLVSGFCFYRLMRYALGHRRFRGVWYNRARYHQLLIDIHRHQQETARVLAHDELEAIRKAMYPDIKPIHKGRYGGYF